MIDISKKMDEALLARAAKKNTARDMTCFHAADCEKNVFDLYHSLIGTPQTNPPDLHSLDRFIKGEKSEEIVYTLLNELNLVEFGGQEQYTIDENWNGIRIVGHPDFLLKDGTLIENKSWYGYYQEQELAAGKPKVSYLKQLAVYMFFLEKQRGELFMEPLEPIHQRYQFPLFQLSPGRFKCNDIEFDITQEFARWKRLWDKNVVPRIEPKSEYRYKTPINEINWSKLSKSAITEARMGRKVIGDWQVAYSAYRDLIIEREGSAIGYSLEELALINKLTAGFSSKK